MKAGGIDLSQAATFGDTRQRVVGRSHCRSTHWPCCVRRAVERRHCRSTLWPCCVNQTRTGSSEKGNPAEVSRHFGWEDMHCRHYYPAGWLKQVLSQRDAHRSHPHPSIEDTGVGESQIHKDDVARYFT